MANSRGSASLAAACAAVVLAIQVAASALGAEPSASQGPATPDEIANARWQAILKKARPGVFPPGMSHAERDKALRSLPDWSGAWFTADTNNILDAISADPPNASGNVPGDRQHPPYNATYETKLRERIARQFQGFYVDPLAYCMPAGMPRILIVPFNHEFIVTPEVVVHINEHDSQVRVIFTDGRQHPPKDQLKPTWQGHSIGYWDGDTLVVDTVGVRQPELIAGAADQTTDRTGAILSSEAEFTERIRKISEDRLEIVMVVYDPVALVRPWMIRRVYKRPPPETTLFDLYCEESMSLPGGERNPVVDGATQVRLPNDPPGFSVPGRPAEKSQK